MAKHIQYSGYKMHRGQQYSVVFNASSDAHAARIMECSTYNIRTYFYKSEMRVDELVANPNTVFAKIDSGDIPNARPDVFRKWIPQKDIIEIINAYVNDKYKHK